MDTDIKKKATQIIDQCAFMHLSDAIFIIEGFQKNKPHLKIECEQVQTRNIMNYHKSYELITNTLLLKAQDEVSNEIKCIEVFLVENVKYGIESFERYAKKCLKLVRQDLVARVFDSYYVDDHHLYFVVEYEYFQIIDNSNINQNRIDRINIRTHLKGILHYLEKSFKTYSKTLYQEQNISMYNLLAVKIDENQGVRVILNAVDPYLFEEPNYQSLVEKKISITPLTLPANFLICTDTYIQKENFLSYLQDQYFPVLQEHGEIIQALITSKLHYTSYSLLKSSQQSITLGVISKSEILKEQNLRVKLKKYTQRSEAKRQLDRYIEQHSKFNQINLFQVSQSYELISLQSSDYIIEETDQHLLNELIPIQNIIKEYEKFFTSFDIKEHQLITQFNMKHKWRFDFFLDKINILIKLLEISEYIKSSSAYSTQIFVHQRTNQWYLSLSKTISNMKKYQIQNQISLYKNICQRIIAMFTIFFEYKNDAKNKQSYSLSFNELNRQIEEHFSFLYSEDQNIDQEHFQNNLKQLKASFQTIKRVVNINYQFELIIFRISFYHLNALTFSIRQYDMPTNHLLNLIQFFKENKNIENIEMNMFNCFQSLYALSQQDKKLLGSIGNNPVSTENIEKLNEENVKFLLCFEIDKYLLSNYPEKNEEYRKQIKNLTLQSLEDNYNMGTLQIKPQENQIHNRSLCSTSIDELPKLLTTKVFLERIIASIVQEKILTIVENNFYSNCIAEDNNEFQFYLANLQPNLRSWTLSLSRCKSQSQEIISSDYFEFKKKTNLLKLKIITKSTEDFEIVFNQLKSNPNKINTIICSSILPLWLFQIQKKMIERMLRKLKRLVVISE